MLKEVQTVEFNELVGEGVVLADFFSTTCGPCKMLAFVLNDVEKALGDKVKILKVDFDQTDSDFYDKYYDYFITEYNANLEASIYINKLVNNTNLKHLNTKETLRLIGKAYKDEALGIKFLNLLGENMDNYNYEQLTVKERVLYGFPRK